MLIGIVIGILRLSQKSHPVLGGYAVCRRAAQHARADPVDLGILLSASAPGNRSRFDNILHRCAVAPWRRLYRRKSCVAVSRASIVARVEAAKTIGLSHFQTMMKIILPQALRRMIPPAGQRRHYVTEIFISGFGARCRRPDLQGPGPLQQRRSDRWKSTRFLGRRVSGSLHCRVLWRASAGNAASRDRTDGWRLQRQCFAWRYIKT